MEITNARNIGETGVDFQLRVRHVHQKGKSSLYRSFIHLKNHLRCQTEERLHACTTRQVHEIQIGRPHILIHEQIIVIAGHTEVLDQAQPLQSVPVWAGGWI